MSNTVCPKCNEPTIFEMYNEDVENSTVEIKVIRCKTCKTAISFISDEIILQKIEGIETSIRELKNKSA